MKRTNILPAALTALAFALLAPLAAAQTTTRLNANKINEYALIYTLPQNGFAATLAAEKTVKTPGPFALYAKRYLHLDPILEASTSWRIVGAELSLTAVEDLDERYQVQFKSGSTPFMLLSPEGFPLSVNAESIVELSSASSLKAHQTEPTILETDVARQAMTEDMLKSTSTAKRAELAAARIYEIRQNRSEIIAGQADGMPSDGAAMQLALDQLAAQEAALTAMFVGTEATSVEVRTFEFDAPADSVGTQRFVVARLSQVEGLLPADNLAGAPVYADFSDLRLGELPMDDKGRQKNFPKGGLAYRIPGSVKAALVYDGKTLCSGRFDVAQYGCVFGIDPGLFADKKAPAYAKFHPLTGALLELGTLAKPE